MCCYELDAHTDPSYLYPAHAGVTFLAPPFSDFWPLAEMPDNSTLDRSPITLLGQKRESFLLVI